MSAKFEHMQETCCSCMFQGGPDKGVSNIGLNFDVRGWVRTVRHQKIISFIEASQYD